MMNYQNKHGFTIMEVLLALVISCVVMVASVPILTVQKNYGHIEKWNRNQSGADVFYGSPKDNLKVGIGTTTPRTRLHVRGYEDRPTTPVMTIRAANNTGDHSVNFVFADSNLNEVGRLAATTRDGTSIAIGAGAANLQITLLLEKIPIKMRLNTEVMSLSEVISQMVQLLIMIIAYCAETT